jgi:replicative DNA helicase
MQDENDFLPVNFEFEKSLLCAMMASETGLLECVGSLDTADFYANRQVNQVIFESIKRLFDKAAPVDMKTVMADLNTTGLLDKVGGEAYFTEIGGAYLPLSNIDYYIKGVKAYTGLRTLLSTSRRVDATYRKGTVSDIELFIADADEQIRQALESHHIDDFKKIDVTRDII